MAMGHKKGTQKTLLVKGKIDQNLSLGLFFLTQSHIFLLATKPRGVALVAYAE